MNNIISSYIAGVLRGIVYLAILCIFLVISDRFTSFIRSEESLPEIPFISGLVLSIGAAFVASKHFDKRPEISKMRFMLLSSALNLGILLVSLFVVRKFFPGWIS